LREISEEHSQRLEVSQRTVNNVLRKIAREQEEKIEDLLGRLKDKYKVRLSCPTFDLSHFPYNITLGDKKFDVDLEDWGSGTRNRTLVLLTVFRAKQVADSQVSASKVTPVIVIEEPESFLHPLAQAEFGRVLQDLSEEFQVQIIVTTHSPYLLSQARPESNILLERKTTRRQLRQTERVDTSGDKWMEPFALSLGLSDDSFIPWRELFFSQPEAVLLVEGDTDREYFELLRSEDHGKDQLDFSGIIFPYGGRDTLKNQALLRFIKDRFERVFVTFDLDSKGIVEKSLTSASTG
jgi:putative ATP-dependent endonuclease of the OLD family